MVAKNLLHDVLSLPAADRQELAERIWDSLRSDPASTSLTESQKALLDQRLAEMEADPDDEMSLEDVDARLRVLKLK
jgi:putative addiction module component (TIGR02574 family)